MGSFIGTGMVFYCSTSMGIKLSFMYQFYYIICIKVKVPYFRPDLILAFSLEDPPRR